MIMHRHQPWKSYQQVAAQTASPGQLILMLYDGALKFLEQARQGFTLVDDPVAQNETINNSIQRATAIISELNVCLDMRAGEVAVTLRRLYEYFNWRLLQSNIQKNPDGVNEVIAQLSTLRDAWAEMLGNPGGTPSIRGFGSAEEVQSVSPMAA